MRADPKPVNNLFLSFQALKRKKTHGKKTHASVTVTVVRDADRAKNQSDCRIRYRARLEKNNNFYFTLKLTNPTTFAALP